MGEFKEELHMVEGKSKHLPCETDIENEILRLFHLLTPKVRQMFLEMVVEMCKENARKEIAHGKVN